MEYSSFTWNTNRKNLGGGLVVSDIRGKWVNTPYLVNGKNTWSPIKAEFVRDGSRFEANKIPGKYNVPELATSAVDFEVYQSFNVFDKSIITDTPWSMEIIPENVSPVAGVLDDAKPSQVVYPNAFGQDADLRYTIWHGRGPRVTREIVIRSEPHGTNDPEYSFVIRSSKVRAYVKQNGTYVRPWAGNVGDTATAYNFGISLRAGTSDDNESLWRGSGVKTPYAWYYTPSGVMVRIPITVRFEIVDVDMVRATKVVPRSFIQEAFAAGATAVMCDDTSTFYPDPDTETNSVDGYCWRGTVDESMATIRSGAGTFHEDNFATTEIDWLRCTTTTNQYAKLSRWSYGFDTSSIGTDTIDQVDISIYHNGTAQTFLDCSIAYCASAPASDTDLVNSDYENAFSDTKFSSDIAESTWNANGAYFDTTLNASGEAHLNGSGTTHYGLRPVNDIDNTDNWSAGDYDRWKGLTAEQTGTTKDPKLVVTHSVASSPAVDMTDHLESGLANRIFRGNPNSWSLPTGIWIGLTTDSPSDDDPAANELTGGAYARVEVTQATGSWTEVTTDGVIENLVDVSFTQANAQWLTASGVIICDSETAGNVLFKTDVSSPTAVASGDTARFPSGTISITLT